MLVARAARLFSNSRRLARRGQPRLGVLPLGLEAKSACCSRQELSADIPASLSAARASTRQVDVGAPSPHTCDAISRALRRLRRPKSTQGLRKGLPARRREWRVAHSGIVHPLAGARLRSGGAFERAIFDVRGLDAVATER